MKKKSGKRFLSWLLAVVMIIALMPAIAFAEPPTESSGNTEPAVTSYCPSSEGGTDVSVGGYDSSPAAETKDIPTEEPVKDTPTDEPAKDTPTAEPVKESPVEDKTTEGTPAQVGAVENSTDEKITEDLKNEVSAAELAGLTAMFAAPVSLELYANKSYPIYVYGYFVNGKDKNDEDNILSGKDGLFGKDIKIQKDNKKVQTVKWNDYSIIGKPKSDYITFGKIENGTTVKPAKDAEKESISADVLEAMLTASLGDSTDMQNQYFSWKDVAIDDWDLHIARDATNYSDEDGKYTWHMDGKIHTYKIKYMADSTDVSKEAHVDKNTYYCGTYTIDTYKPNAPKGKVFAGWTVNDDTNSGKYYQGGDTITLKDHDTDNTGKITLKAQWEDQKYPVYVYGLFKYKNTTFDKNSSLYINGSTDSINLNNDSFITFGALNDATTFDPAPYKDQGVISKETIPTAEIEARIEKGDVELSDSTGSAKTNGLLTESTKISPLVSKWYGLKSCPGATDYVEGDDATWHLDGEINLYKVTYAKGNIPDGEDFTLPKEETYFLGDYTVRKMETSSQNYKFLGWVYENELLKEGSTIKAPNKDITLTAKWEKKPVVYKVNYDWGTFAPSDKTCPTGGTYNTEEAAKADMDKIFTNTSTSNAPNGSIAGSWKFSGWTETKTTSDDGNTILIALTGTWKFTPSETKTITSVLNTLVWKDFKSQHGYSTEGTFTAIAKVMPVHPEINSYAAEVDESSDNNTNTPGTDNAKTFTGTVNLKTGETRAFNFSAGKGVADVLDPDTYYEVRVSEVEGNLSKVTYDTTKYILTFTTDRNAVVDYIWIAKEKDSENDHPELEPVEGTTITFHNIYTYKRHHSSSDGGNGGGKKEEKPTVEIKDDDALGLNNTDHFAYIVGYGNGEVRPQNSITRAEVAAIFFRLLEDDVRDANYTRQNKFTDVSNDAWYCSAVSTLSAMGIISGYPDATFRPNASITRAEFAAIATRFDVNGDKTPASFNDIAGHWAKDEIAVAANNGWVNGYEDGSFRPQNKITRAETMSLVNRVLNRKPETAEDLLENMTKWTDNADTNAWYYLAVQEATNSHYYEYKENSQYEKWTELRETRDWSELDK